MGEGEERRGSEVGRVICHTITVMVKLLALVGPLLLQESSVPLLQGHRLETHSSSQQKIELRMSRQ